MYSGTLDSPLVPSLISESSYLGTLRIRSRTSFSTLVIYTIDGDRVAALLVQYPEDTLTWIYHLPRCWSRSFKRGP